jgi:hypothetical protein
LVFDSPSWFLQYYYSSVGFNGTNKNLGILFATFL